MAMGKWDVAVTLLKLGANPNIEDTAGRTAVMIAAGYLKGYEILDLIIAKGGNVNAIAQRSRTTYYTPLIAASRLPHPVNAQILIEAGADPNYVYSAEGIRKSALSEAFLTRRIKIIDYYMFELGLSFQPEMLNKDSYFDPLSDLRNMTIPLDSEDYKIKRKIIKKLKKEYGMNYESYPVPDYIKRRIKNNFPNVKGYIDVY